MRTSVNGRADLPSHQLAMTLLMTPDMANFMGNVHGGAILKLQIKWPMPVPVAMQAVYNDLVSGSVTFREPIHVGELVTFSLPSTTPATLR